MTEQYDRVRIYGRGKREDVPERTAKTALKPVR